MSRCMSPVGALLLVFLHLARLHWRPFAASFAKPESLPSQVFQNKEKNQSLHIRWPSQFSTPPGICHTQHLGFPHTGRPQLRTQGREARIFLERSLRGACPRGRSVVRFAARPFSNPLAIKVVQDMRLTQKDEKNIRANLLPHISGLWKQLVLFVLLQYSHVFLLSMSVLSLSRRFLESCLKSEASGTKRVDILAENGRVPILRSCVRPQIPGSR